LVLQISNGNLSKLQKVGDLLSRGTFGCGSSHSKQILQTAAAIAAATKNFDMLKVHILIEKYFITLAFKFHMGF
jgi:hypothetical protein